MGNDIGYIKTDNLQGTVQAFAEAADLDQNGRVDANELALFNRLINQAGLNQDKGLRLEREQLETRGKVYTSEQLKNKEDEEYKRNFRKLSDKDLVALKAQVASYDKQIIAVFKELKRANDTGNIMKLNEVIANRPDMSNYSTTAEYLDAFNQYVREAEKILEESNREFQTNLAQGVHEHIDNNTTELENLTVAVGGAVIENDNLNFAQLEKDIEDGTAQIIKEVKLEGGKTRVTIRNAKGEIIGAVRTAERHIIRDVDSQGAQIRKTIEEDGNKTRVAIKQDGDDTRNVIQERADETNELVKEDIAIGIDNLQETKAEADRIISTLDPTGLKRVMSWLRDQALNAGQSVGDFIKNNPTLPMSPVLGAPGLTLGAIAGGLLKKMEQQ